MADEESGVTAPVPAVALGVSMNVQVDNNRQLVFQTHVDRDAPIGELHETLDKISKAADRQVARYMLLGLNKELRQHEQALNDQLEDTARVEEANREAWEASGRKGAFKLGPKEQAALANIQVSKQKFAAQIADIKARIAETEAKIADLG